jgi:hypothetical protein
MNNLRFPFTGSDLLPAFSSQAGQDLFVLGVLNGKTNGTYLEIGSGPAVTLSNTYMLETQFGWRGAGVEISEFWYNEHKSLPRKHYIELGDATSIDYTSLLIKAGITTTDIDYASVDCDPPNNTFAALTRLPFDTHRFAVLTFEHDAYAWGDEYKQKSRDFLTSKGYELVVTNIKPTSDQGDFEDWWVHPGLVDPAVIERFKRTDDNPKLWHAYIFLG